MAMAADQTGRRPRSLVRAAEWMGAGTGHPSPGRPGGPEVTQRRDQGDVEDVKVTLATARVTSDQR